MRRPRHVDAIPFVVRQGSGLTPEESANVEHQILRKELWLAALCLLGMATSLAIVFWSSYRAY